MNADNSVASESPGKGETSSLSDDKAVECSQNHLDIRKECISPLGSRSNSEPAIKKQSYEFSEEKYLQDIKTKPAPNVAKEQRLPKSGDIAPPDGKSSGTSDKVKIKMKIEGKHVDKKDFAEDKAWIKLRKDYLANEGR